jgi:4'-phosphopantetheinyl transferase EntD
MTTRNARLEGALDAVTVPGILVAHRIIAEGDEHSLLPQEQIAFAGSVVKVRRASGAGRQVARDLMRRFGVEPQPIIKTTAGMPVWPDGLIGSMAHDATIAVAALARRDRFRGIGIDIEPAEPLEANLLDLIATEREREVHEWTVLQGRLLFSVKEAVYKAVFPIDRIFLDHHDVEVNFNTATAVVRYGRKVDFHYDLGAHIVTLAFIPL